jgi:hypothetical protein
MTAFAEYWMIGLAQDGARLILCSWYCAAGLEDV